MTAVSFQGKYFPISLKLISPSSVQATISIEGKEKPSHGIYIGREQTSVQDGNYTIFYTAREVWRQISAAFTNVEIETRKM